MNPEEHVVEFERRRSLLFTVAYQILGSAADAEDVVQDAWLQWDRAAHAEVRDVHAFLIRIATRQALNRRRAQLRRRETYVGEWLPEPLLTSPDVADVAELAESVSIAMLTVLETLGPTERAIFILHDVFAVPYEEIAVVVGKKPAATRQIARRSRSRIAAQRPRRRVSPREHAEITTRLISAMRTGELADLLALLAPNVIAIGDGGGLAKAAPYPIIGAAKVARFLQLFGTSDGIELTLIHLNGSPAIMIKHGPHLHAVIAVEVEDEAGVRALYGISNPTKLTRIDTPVALAVR